MTLSFYFNSVMQISLYIQHQAIFLSSKNPSTTGQPNLLLPIRGPAGAESQHPEFGKCITPLPGHRARPATGAGHPGARGSRGRKQDRDHPNRPLPPMLHGAPGGQEVPRGPLCVGTQERSVETGGKTGPLLHSFPDTVHTACSID